MRACNSFPLCVCAQEAATRAGRGLVAALSMHASDAGDVVEKGRGCAGGSEVQPELGRTVGMHTHKWRTAPYMSVSRRF